MASHTGESPSPNDNAPQTIIYRAITLRVDLRALAALGGALIIVGGLLPWVTPLFEPFQRALRPVMTGGWLILAIGVVTIGIVFLPRFRTPRASTPAAAFGLIAGLLALNSAINTLSLRDVVVGTQSVSTFTGIGLGVYFTLAGSIIAILAGLAPQPPNGEPARAEIRLWQPSIAIFGSLFVVLVVGAIGLGLWLGGGGSTGQGPPTPQAFDTGLLTTPLINAQVNPLLTETPGAPGVETTPSEPTPEPPIQPTNEIAPPTSTPVEPVESPTPTPTVLRFVSPTPTDTAVPTPTDTPTPSPSPTSGTSPLGTPTISPTPTITLTTGP